jgi:hypothetical protein
MVTGGEWQPVCTICHPAQGDLEESGPGQEPLHSIATIITLISDINTCCRRRVQKEIISNHGTVYEINSLWRPRKAGEVLQVEGN